MAGQLEGSVAVVTGAARGIGRAIAARFAAEGAQVIIDDVDDTAGQEAVATILAEGGQAHYVHADISQLDQVATLLRTTEEQYGPPDILVNNALPATRRRGLAGRPRRLRSACRSGSPSTAARRRRPG